MNTLVIYDSEGYILSQMSGNIREPVGIPFMWTEIPEGKRVVAIDVTKNPHEPIFEDYPQSEYDIKFQKMDEDIDNIVNSIIMMSVPIFM